MSVCMFVSTSKVSTQEGGIKKLKFCDWWTNDTFSYSRNYVKVDENGKAVFE